MRNTSRWTRRSWLPDMKILALLALVCAGAFAGPGKDKPRVIRITAQKFKFEPDEIHVKAGEDVVFQLKSLDRTHGFKIPDLKLRVDVTTAAVTAVPFTALKEGTFTFQCDVFCGLHHEDMNGTLIVEK